MCTPITVSEPGRRGSLRSEPTNRRHASALRLLRPAAPHGPGAEVRFRAGGAVTLSTHTTEEPNHDTLSP